MNNWSNEGACVLMPMLKDYAAAILENLSSSDLRDFGKITSALKLRFGAVYLTELLHGQLNNYTASQGGFDYVCIRSPKLS
nr:unnamed protein product [Callosobruchus chinensis]